MPNVYIYALVDPRSGLVRYVGKSVRPTDRLSNHCNEQGNSHRHRWLRQLRALELKPTLTILEEVTSGTNWQEAERRWIAYGHAHGWRLTNSTSGGDGVQDLSPEIRARMALTWTGRKHRPESLLRIGLASKGRTHTQAYKDFMRATMSGRKIVWVNKVSRSLCKLTAEQIEDVKTALAQGTMQYVIATRYGVHKSTISNIHRGKGYKWLTSETV